MKKGAAKAFTLVEVALALAIFAFALTVVIALLPIGIRSNRVSVEESKALGLLTALDGDLRNSSPLLNNNKSEFFGLTLPYTADSTGKYSVNPTLSASGPAGTVATGCTTGFNDDGTVTPSAGRYQVTVVYTRVPQLQTSTSLAPIEAHLIVNWPFVNTTNAADLSNPAKVDYVDTYVSFPCP